VYYGAVFNDTWEMGRGVEDRTFMYILAMLGMFTWCRSIMTGKEGLGEGFFC